MVWKDAGLSTAKIKIDTLSTADFWRARLQTKKYHFRQTGFPNHEATRTINSWTLLRKTQRVGRKLWIREQGRKLVQRRVHHKLNWSRDSKGTSQTKCRVETSVGTGKKDVIWYAQPTAILTTQKDSHSCKSKHIPVSTQYPIFVTFK